MEMEARRILLKWQRYNPRTGDFDFDRTAREWAKMLGISESYLSHIYSGRRRLARGPLLTLVAMWPAAAADLAPVQRAA